MKPIKNCHNWAWQPNCGS